VKNIFDESMNIIQYTIIHNIFSFSFLGEVETLFLNVSILSLKGKLTPFQ
jgi:hypothetical protein